MSCRIAAFAAILCIILLELLTCSLAKPAHELRSEALHERIKRSSYSGNVHNKAIKISENKQTLKISAYDNLKGAILTIENGDEMEQYPFEPSEANTDIFKIETADRTRGLKFKFKNFNLLNPSKEWINIYDHQQGKQNKFKMLTSKKGEYDNSPLVEEGNEYYSDGNALDFEFHHGYYNEKQVFEIDVESVQYAEPSRLPRSHTSDINTYKGIENHFYLCQDDGNQHQIKKINGESAGQLQGEIWSTSGFQEDELSYISEDIHKCSVEFQLDEGDKIEFKTKKVAISNDEAFCSQSKITIKGNDAENSFCSVDDKVIETEADQDGKIKLEFIHEISAIAYGFWLEYRVKKKEQKILTNTTNSSFKQGKANENEVNAIKNKTDGLSQATPMIFFVCAAVVAILLIVILAVAGIVACMRTHQQDQLISTLTEQLTNQQQQYTPVEGSLVSINKAPLPGMTVPDITFRRATIADNASEEKKGLMSTSTTSSPVSSSDNALGES